MGVCPALQSDMNLDGHVTISDLSLQIKWLLGWSGNQVVELLALTGPLARYLEISRDSCGGWIATSVTLVVCLIVLNVIAARVNPKPKAE